MRISHPHSPYQGTRGFTLVELLAVMAIIRISSGMVAGAVTGLGTTGISAQIISDTKTKETAADCFLNDSYCKKKGIRSSRPTAAKKISKHGSRKARG